MSAFDTGGSGPFDVSTVNAGSGPFDVSAYTWGAPVNYPLMPRPGDVPQPPPVIITTPAPAPSIFGSAGQVSPQTLIIGALLLAAVVYFMTRK